MLGDRNQPTLWPYRFAVDAVLTTKARGRQRLWCPWSAGGRSRVVEPNQRLSDTGSPAEPSTGCRHAALRPRCRHLRLEESRMRKDSLLQLSDFVLRNLPSRWEELKALEPKAWLHHHPRPDLRCQPGGDLRPQEGRPRGCPCGDPTPDAPAPAPSARGLPPQMPVREDPPVHSPRASLRREDHRQVRGPAEGLCSRNSAHPRARQVGAVLAPFRRRVGAICP